MIDEKPKEFWIDPRPHSGRIGFKNTGKHTAWSFNKVFYYYDLRQPIHTIEFSAYEKERKKVLELQEKLDLLRRYHGGDGTITREMVIETLSEGKG